jgi:hypothetical protein
MYLVIRSYKGVWKIVSPKTVALEFKTLRQAQTWIAYNMEYFNV